MNILRQTKRFLRKLTQTRLEDLPDSPDYFRMYRRFLADESMERVPGGWRYDGSFYPDYLFMGGACGAIIPRAKRYLSGNGIDVGAGFWTFPGAVAVDPFRGSGQAKSLDDFAPDSLDFVFSSHCLEHVSDWRSELLRWGGLVRPGGKLCLYLPHPDCGIWRRGAPGIGDGHKWVPDFPTVKDALEKSGMKIIDSDRGPDAMMSFYICAQK